MSEAEHDRRALALLTPALRRTLGAVYTPPAEVALASTIALERWREGVDERDLEAVCDPACGAGAFLVGFLAATGERPPVLVGVDADAGAVAIAAERLPEASLHHGDALVLDPARFAWGRQAPASYDLVIGNPPYVRHQSLRDPFGRADDYAARVHAAVATLAPGLALSRRADLAAAFLVLGVSLLRPGGVLAFVTTSAWLDAAYGDRLGHHLLDAGLVDLVDRPAERTFATAAVGSLIVVVRRGARGPVAVRSVGGATRLVERPAMRERAKWGGRLLRAPAALAAVERGLLDGVALGEVARVGGYLITGCDRYFYLRPDQVEALGLARDLVRPVVKSTRGEQRIVLDGAPSRLLFSCREPATAGSRTAAYLEHGVAEGVPTLSGVRARPIWSAIEQEPAPILCVRTTRDRHVVYRNPGRWASGEFYRVDPPAGIDPDPFAAFLSSAVCGLQLEALGRAYGGGGGPLKVERSDLVALRLPTVAVLASASDALAAAFGPLLRRPIGTVAEEAQRPDRRVLERLCGSLAGLDEAGTDAVVDAHARAVGARVDRARRTLEGTGAGG